MTQYFSYIGDPDAPPFRRDQPDQGRYRMGNLPLRVMPDNWGDLGIDIEEVMRLAREGVYEGSRSIGCVGGQDDGPTTSGVLFRHSRRLVTGLELRKTHLLVAAEGVWKVRRRSTNFE